MKHEVKPLSTSVQIYENLFSLKHEPVIRFTQNDVIVPYCLQNTGISSTYANTDSCCSCRKA